MAIFAEQEWSDPTNYSDALCGCMKYIILAEYLHNDSLVVIILCVILEENKCNPTRCV